MSLRSPIGRVLGLGAAKEGVSHWWTQRVSAVALVILTLWFIVALLRIADFSHAAVTAWMAAPLNSVLLILLVGTLVYHSQLGVQVVIEDYIERPGLKLACLLLSKFIHVAVAAVSLFAVLRIAFGATAGSGV
jgi:succinate dehydrogenase membrane anchor subunit